MSTALEIRDSINELEDEIECRKNALMGQLCEVAVALSGVGLIEVDGDAVTSEIEGLGGGIAGIVEVRLTLRQVS